MREIAIQTLCDLLPPGSTVHTTERTRSKSGMTSTHDVCAVVHGTVVRITSLVADATGRNTTSKGRLTVRGWGADAGWTIVMDLSYVLHGTVGAGRGLEPNGECKVPDASNYRAGHSLVWKEL